MDTSAALFEVADEIIREAHVRMSRADEPGLDKKAVDALLEQATGLLSAAEIVSMANKRVMAQDVTQTVH